MKAQLPKPDPKQTKGPVCACAKARAFVQAEDQAESVVTWVLQQ